MTFKAIANSLSPEPDILMKQVSDMKRKISPLGISIYEEEPSQKRQKIAESESSPQGSRLVLNSQDQKDQNEVDQVLEGLL